MPKQELSPEQRRLRAQKGNKPQYQHGKLGILVGGAYVFLKDFHPGYCYCRIEHGVETEIGECIALTALDPYARVDFVPYGPTLLAMNPNMVDAVQVYGAQAVALNVPSLPMSGRGGIGDLTPGVGVIMIANGSAWITATLDAAIAAYGTKLVTGSAATRTLAGNAVTTGLESVLTLTPSGGSSDTLITLTLTGVPRLLLLYAAGGDTITLQNHGTGNLYLNGGRDFVLSGEVGLLVYHDGTKAHSFSEINLSTPGAIGATTPGTLKATTGDFTGILTTESGQVRKVRVITAAGAVTVATTDDFVIVNKSSGAATAVNLPGSPTTGQTFVIHDGKGDAATNPLTITPAAGNINGAGTLVLNTAYASAIVTYNGTQWDALVAASSGGGSSPLTTKGDIFYYTSTNDRLPVGLDGQFPGEVLGDVAWIYPEAPASFIDPTTADHDMLMRHVTTVTALKIVFIGDSITSNFSIPSTCATDLSQDGVTVTSYNEGVSGTSTSDWAIGSSNDTTANAAYVSNGCRAVSIALGVNDARVAVRNSVATYLAQLQAICNGWVARGAIVFLHYPTYCVPGSNAGDQDATANTLRIGYQAAINVIVNGSTIRLGDTTGYALFALNPGLLTDGIHPGSTGQTDLALAWANGLRSGVSTLTQVTTLQRVTLGAGLVITDGSPAVLDTTFTGETIYAPLVTGDTPGPTPVATVDGQFIMVPLP